MILVYQKKLVVIKNLFKIECFYDEEKTITLYFNNYNEQYKVFDLIKNGH